MTILGKTSGRSLPLLRYSPFTLLTVKNFVNGIITPTMVDALLCHAKNTIRSFGPAGYVSAKKGPMRIGEKIFYLDDDIHEIPLMQDTNEE